MKRLIAGAALAATLVLGMAWSASAAPWRTIVDREASRSVTVSAWSRDYRSVRFTAGHAEFGDTGSFLVRWSVSCRGGYYRTGSIQAHDTPEYFWGKIIRIPAGQRRCFEKITAEQIAFGSDPLMYASIAVR